MLNFGQVLLNIVTGNTTNGKTYPSILSLIEESIILVDLYFLVNYPKTFFIPNR